MNGSIGAQVTARPSQHPKAKQPHNELEHINICTSQQVFKILNIIRNFSKSSGSQKEDSLAVHQYGPMRYLFYCTDL